MAKKPGLSDSKPATFVVGRSAFAKISAVEGLKMSPSMRKDFEEFDRKKLSPDKRREALSSKYGKKR